MPWCPKCKSEYREGFSVCIDCGSQLTEEKPADKQEIPVFWSGSMGLPMDGVLGQDSSQRADENRSSAWILLIVGSLGLVMVILGIMEVLPFPVGNSYLFYGVMGAVFILFEVTGVISMKNARFFEGKAESENSLRSTLLDWCRENLYAAEIDGEVGAEGVAEEVLYFSRTAYIKEKLNHQFVNLDQDFLDKFVDDHVYGMVFESEKV